MTGARRRTFMNSELEARGAEGGEVEARGLAEHEIDDGGGGDGAELQSGWTVAGGDEDVLPAGSLSEHRLLIFAEGAQADAHFQDGGRFQTFGDGECLAQHFGDAACCQAGIETRFVLAGGSGDDAAGREGEQIVRVEADDDWPGARILPAHFEVDDLPALWMQRDRHVKLLADGS